MKWGIEEQLSIVQSLATPSPNKSKDMKPNAKSRRLQGQANFWLAITLGVKFLYKKKLWTIEGFIAPLELEWHVTRYTTLIGNTVKAHTIKWQILQSNEVFMIDEDYSLDCFCIIWTTKFLSKLLGLLGRRHEFCSSIQLCSGPISSVNSTYSF